MSQINTEFVLKN